jgi:hypothetical protein
MAATSSGVLIPALHMTTISGQFLPFPPRPISAPQTLFRHGTLPIDEWCNRWCAAGAPHHMAAAQGRWTEQLLDLAQMLGIEAVVV